MSHLFFADDSLLFTKACVSQDGLGKEVLEVFCMTLSLKVHIDKSRFSASKNVSNTKRGQIDNIINFPYTSNKGEYLKFPIFTGRVTKREFNFIMDHIRGKLAGRSSSS